MPPQAVGLVCQVCEATGEAHGLGIVHRDIDPENAVLPSSPNETLEGAVVKLVHFSIAKEPATRRQRSAPHVWASHRLV